jgi:hypothetical protein
MRKLLVALAIVGVFGISAKEANATTAPPWYVEQCERRGGTMWYLSNGKFICR